jgi:hypothetical protein
VRQPRTAGWQPNTWALYMPTHTAIRTTNVHRKRWLTPEWKIQKWIVEGVCPPVKTAISNAMLVANRAGDCLQRLSAGDCIEQGCNTCHGR